MVKKLELTEDRIKLISNMVISGFVYGKHEAVEPNQISSSDCFGINLNHIWGGSYLFEDMALILGFYDDFLEGTDGDYEGRRYSEEREKYMVAEFNWFKDNMYFIESLIHHYATKGGLTPGTYKCIDYKLDWEKVE